MSQGILPMDVFILVLNLLAALFIVSVLVLVMITCIKVIRYLNKKEKNQ